MRTIAINFVNATPVFMRNTIRAGQPVTRYNGFLLTTTTTTSGSGGEGGGGDDDTVQNPVPTNEN